MKRGKGKTMPLTKDQLKDIKTAVSNAEEMLKGVMADIAQAKRAGIDVADNEKLATDLRERIRKLKAVYLV